MVGGPLPELWAKAGHYVFLRSRHQRVQARAVLEAMQFVDATRVGPNKSLPDLTSEVDEENRYQARLDWQKEFWDGCRH